MNSLIVVLQCVANNLSTQTGEVRSSNKLQVISLFLQTVHEKVPRQMHSIICSCSRVSIYAAIEFYSDN